jgi:anti-anti-sigma regulatory factor
MSFIIPVFLKLLARLKKTGKTSSLARRNPAARTITQMLKATEVILNPSYPCAA